MADTGILEHSDRLGGGVLRLKEEDGVHTLVLAGPRDELNNYGRVAIYGSGDELATLDVTAADEGRLILRVPDAGVPFAAVVIQAGSDNEDGAAVPRASIVLRNAAARDQRIELGFDDSGPFIKLVTANAVTTLSAAGLSGPRRDIPDPGLRVDPRDRRPPF